MSMPVWFRKVDVFRNWPAGAIQVLSIFKPAKSIQFGKLNQWKGMDRCTRNRVWGQIKWILRAATKQNVQCSRRTCQPFLHTYHIRSVCIHQCKRPTHEVRCERDHRTLAMPCKYTSPTACRNEMGRDRVCLCWLRYFSYSIVYYIRAATVCVPSSFFSLPTVSRRRIALFSHHISIHTLRALAHIQ